MKLKKLDALLVPKADMYSGEEVPDDEERLKYITNFSGSAGYAVISANSYVKSAGKFTIPHSCNDFRGFGIFKSKKGWNLHRWNNWSWWAHQ